MNILVVIPAIILIAIIFSAVFTVNQQIVALIERFGRFHKVSHAGLNIKIPFIDRISGRLSLRVRQLDVPIETKTNDNVFVKVGVSVQFHVLPEKVFDAFYKLNNPQLQIQSFVFDAVRAKVPKMTLDSVFENKDEIADYVKTELSEQMSEFGYIIIKALITDIDPDAKVKAAMNEINEQQRLREAAKQKGEAEKIMKVKIAEAEAESMRLNGQGIADQRKAIIEGLQTSVESFQKGIAGVSSMDVMNLVLITQYYDTLKEIGSKSNSNTILLPHKATEGISDMASQFRESIITGSLAAAASNAKPDTDIT
jgi:regulator of protease activity HflC (stomatin/prohibitin superfamily)